MVYYIGLFSKIRCSLTYLPTQKSDVIYERSPVQNGHGGLTRLVLNILDMGLASSVLNGHLDLQLKLWVSKNDDEERCFKK